MVERKSRTFRLPVATIERIDELAEREGSTGTAVVIKAIQKMHEGSTDGEVEALRARLEDAKNENERLASALDQAQKTAQAAQETAKAAQALHAQAEKRLADAEQRVRELPSPDAWKEKSLLDRILRR